MLIIYFALGSHFPFPQQHPTSMAHRERTKVFVLLLISPHKPSVQQKICFISQVLGLTLCNMAFALFYVTPNPPPCFHSPSPGHSSNTDPQTPSAISCQHMVNALGKAGRLQTLHLPCPEALLPFEERNLVTAGWPGIIHGEIPFSSTCWQPAGEKKTKGEHPHGEFSCRGFNFHIAH